MQGSVLLQFSTLRRSSSPSVCNSRVTRRHLVWNKGSTYYQNKHGQQAQYWTWTHRLTGYKLRRFMNTGGRSFETGRLSAYLKDIRERDFPVAYARAQHILMLNKCKGFESAPPDVPITLERRELIAQQVSRLRLCFSFVILYLDLTIAFVLSLLRSSWLYSQLKATLLQPLLQPLQEDTQSSEGIHWACPQAWTC